MSYYRFFFIITVTKHWQYYRNLGSNNKCTIQYKEAHRCLSGNLNRNWVTRFFGAKMKALHSFTATLSSSSPLLLERACRAWRWQQALQEELKHRNILLYPLALHGKESLLKMVSPGITAKPGLTLQNIHTASNEIPLFKVKQTSSYPTLHRYSMLIPNIHWLWPYF